MDVDEFRKRQQADLQRQQTGEHVVRRRPFHERYAHLDRSERKSDRYNNDDDDDDDALATDSEDEADEEIQSPSILNRQSAAEEEGEEA
jgi:hypothetical protein